MISNYGYDADSSSIFSIFAIAVFLICEDSFLSIAGILILPLVPVPFRMKKIGVKHAVCVSYLQTLALIGRLLGYLFRLVQQFAFGGSGSGSNKSNREMGKESAWQKYRAAQAEADEMSDYNQAWEAEMQARKEYYYDLQMIEDLYGTDEE